MIGTILFACFLSILSSMPSLAHARAYGDGHATEAVGREAALVQPRSPRQAGNPLDRDRDGTVSRKEATAHYGWLFAFLDEDRDGAIAAAEFIDVLKSKSAEPAKRQARRARLEELFRRLDADGDRTVDRKEFLTACGAHFATSDRDGDGRVSVREFHARGSF